MAQHSTESTERLLLDLIRSKGAALPLGASSTSRGLFGGPESSPPLDRLLHRGGELHCALDRMADILQLERDDLAAELREHRVAVVVDPLHREAQCDPLEGENAVAKLVGAAASNENGAVEAALLRHTALPYAHGTWLPTCAITVALVDQLAELGATHPEPRVRLAALRAARLWKANPELVRRFVDQLLRVDACRIAADELDAIATLIASPCVKALWNEPPVSIMALVIAMSALASDAEPWAPSLMATIIGMGDVGQPWLGAIVAQVDERRRRLAHWGSDETLGLLLAWSRCGDGAVSQ